MPDILGDEGFQSMLTLVLVGQIFLEFKICAISPAFPDVLNRRATLSAFWRNDLIENDSLPLAPVDAASILPSLYRIDVQNEQGF